MHTAEKRVAILRIQHERFSSTTMSDFPLAVDLDFVIRGVLPCLVRYSVTNGRA